MVVKKAVSTKGFDNGGAYINPNSLKVPPTTVQKIDGETDYDLAAAASGIIHDRYDNYRYYSGDTSS